MLNILHHAELLRAVFRGVVAGVPWSFRTMAHRPIFSIDKAVPPRA